MPLTVAFAPATVVSPTDTVAVAAITRNLPMPSKTIHLLEGESLLNDASGSVALKFTVIATLTGVFSWQNAVKEFIWIAIDGVVIGVAIGWGFSRARDIVSRRMGDLGTTHMLILLPLAAYMLGKHIGVSDILAAVVADMTTNFSDLNRVEFLAERIQAEGAWSMVAIGAVCDRHLNSAAGVALNLADDRCAR